MYLGVCRESWLLALIGYDTFLARLHALREMCSPGDNQWIYADRFLRAEKWEDERLWHADVDSNAPHLNPSNGTSESQIVWSEKVIEEVEPVILQFIPAQATGLGTWVFHKGDADWFPSVPHAHQHSNNKRKLDAFLGSIFLMGIPDGRESRNSIVRLWNDKKFRLFAREAIVHFSQQNPHWIWRVQNPLRLPRIRV